MEIFEKCELFIERLKSFVIDEANAMVGKRKSNGVAARLKCLNQSIVNFHCICHKRALACGDSGDEINNIKDVETALTSIWNRSSFRIPQRGPMLSFSFKCNY